MVSARDEFFERLAKEGLRKAKVNDLE